jgi:hypothetical protein
VGEVCSVGDGKLRIAELEARSQESEFRIQNEKQKTNTSFLLTTGYWILFFFFLTPDTRLRGRSRFVAAKARHLKP